MKNNKHNNDKFDQAFNDRFSDFNWKPEDTMFQRIQEGLEQTSFDQEVKDKFADFSVAPSEEVWKNVEPALPLNLRIKVYLQHLSRVAAILLVGTFGFYLFQLQQTSPGAIVENIPSIEESVAPVTTAAQAGNFVFDIPEPEASTDIASDKKQKTSRKKMKKKGVDDFLAFILDDEDEFDLLSQTEKIKTALRPVEDLSLKFMTASVLQPLPRLESQQLSNTHQDIEIRIDLNVPLQVVEPHEVEALIKMYDEQSGKGN